MKCISWNVNGLRACMGQGLCRLFCCGKRGPVLPARDQAASGANRLCAPGLPRLLELCGEKGLLRPPSSPSGALRVQYGMGKEEHDREGRLITLEFPEFYFATVYVPNSQRELTRLDYRMQWEDDFLAYLQTLDQNKPVIFCGDLNVAHREIDLKNPKPTTKTPVLPMKSEAK